MPCSSVVLVIVHWIRNWHGAASSSARGLKPPGIFFQNKIKEKNNGKLSI
jgi:hypothetical protein